MSLRLRFGEDREHHLADLVAFQLLRTFKLDFAVRELHFRLATEDYKEVPLDIVGVRGDWVCLFEMKLRCDPSEGANHAKNQRRELRKQLLTRISDLGAFNEAWGIWDADFKVLSESTKAEAMGTLQVHAPTTSCIELQVAEPAAPLPQSHSERAESIRRDLRKMRDTWIRDWNGKPAVYLPCAYCAARDETRERWYQPMLTPIWSDYRNERGALDRHAFFCPSNPSRATHYRVGVESRVGNGRDGAAYSSLRLVQFRAWR